MAQRFISLYYGSISPTRALQALFAWLVTLPLSRVRLRERLSEAVRDHIGATSIFPMGSGRGSLAACLKAAGVGPGDEVLLSSYTCLAVPTAVIAAGATPVYADVDPETLNVDVATVDAALGPRVRAVIVQHTLGKPAPVEAIAARARQRGVLVIEDCALAVGSRVAGRQVGTYADAAVFSMELSKTLSCGWGGILVVNDRALAAAAARLYDSLPEPARWTSFRDLLQTAISALCYHPAIYPFGRYAIYLAFKLGLFRRSTPEPEYAGVVAPNFMAKMGAAQAGLARLQWRDLDTVAGACDANARELRGVLDELGAVTPGRPDSDEIGIAPRVSFLVKDRATMVPYFYARGVEVGEWFDGPMSPVPTSPRFNYTPGAYPNAESIAKAIVNLPCHSRVGPADLKRIIAVLREFAGERRDAFLTTPVRQHVHILS